MEPEFQKPLSESLDIGRQDSPPIVPMSVLILWESVSAAGAAKQLCREMEEAGQMSSWKDSMWKFDLLKMRGFRDMAAREASESDWVIVAFENISTLPAELRQWLESWLSQTSGKPQSIVALRVSPAPCGEACMVSGELREFAGQLGARFRESGAGKGT